MQGLHGAQEPRMAARGSWFSSDPIRTQRGRPRGVARGEADRGVDRARRPKGNAPWAFSRPGAIESHPTCPLCPSPPAPLTAGGASICQYLCLDRPHPQGWIRSGRVHSPGDFCVPVRPTLGCDPFSGAGWKEGKATSAMQPAFQRSAALLFFVWQRNRAATL